MKFALIGLLLLTSECCLSQQQFYRGENDFTDKKEEATIFTKFDEKDYPGIKKNFDLSYMMPPAGDQGNKGSCWAWATAYALRSIMDKGNFYTSDGSVNYSTLYSPEYVYQYYKGNIVNCNWGALSYEILDKILKDGLLKYNDFKYYDTACNTYPQITDLMRKTSGIYTKLGYSVVVVNDLFSIKKVIAQGQPLVISIKVDDFFCTKGNIIKGSPIWSNFNNRIGNHAMVVVGYNDTTKLVKVLNSWGKDFGDNGYAYISYSIVNSAMNYACYPSKTADSLPVTTEEKKGGGTVVRDRFNLTSGLPEADSRAFWFKEGYYVPFQHLKIALSELNVRDKFAVVEIRDTNYELLTNFFIEIKSTKEFSISGNKYSLSFDKIASKGLNPFNKAMFFTISKIPETPKFK